MCWYTRFLEEYMAYVICVSQLSVTIRNHPKAMVSFYKLVYKNFSLYKFFIIYKKKRFFDSKFYKLWSMINYPYCFGACAEVAESHREAKPLTEWPESK